MNSNIDLSTQLDRLAYENGFYAFIVKAKLKSELNRISNQIENVPNGTTQRQRVSNILADYYDDTYKAYWAADVASKVQYQSADQKLSDALIAMDSGKSIQEVLSYLH